MDPIAIARGLEKFANPETINTFCAAVKGARGEGPPGTDRAACVLDRARLAAELAAEVSVGDTVADLELVNLLLKG